MRRCLRDGLTVSESERRKLEHSGILKEVLDGVFDLHWDWAHVCFNAQPWAGVAEAIESVQTMDEAAEGSAIFILVLPGDHVTGGLRVPDGVAIVGVNNGSSTDLPARPFVNFGDATKKIAPPREDHVRFGPLTLASGLKLGRNRAVSVFAGVTVNVPDNADTIAVACLAGSAAFVGCSLSSSARYVFHSPLPLCDVLISHSVIETRQKPPKTKEELEKEQKGDREGEEHDVEGDHQAGFCLNFNGGCLMAYKTRIESHSETAIVLTQQTFARLEECDLTSEKGFGAFSSKSRLWVIGCNVHDTGLSGLLTRDESLLVSTGTTFRGSKQCGLLISNGAVVELNDCTVAANVMRGVQISDGADTTAVRCLVEGNREIGMAVVKAFARFVSCRVIGNGGSGVAIMPEAKGEVFQCDVERNKIFGVWFGENSEGSVTECTIVENLGGGVATKSSTTITRNRIIRNSGGISNRGKGTTPVISENELIDNEIPAPCIERAISEGICTYFVTGEKFTAQSWYFCFTCSTSENAGCCAVCAEKCHRGHDLSERQFGESSVRPFCLRFFPPPHPKLAGSFYCDCYPNWKACKANPSATKPC